MSQGYSGELQGHFPKSVNFITQWGQGEAGKYNKFTKTKSDKDD